MAACRVHVEDPFSLEEARPGPARSVPPDKQQAMAWEVLLPDRAHPSASAAQVRWAPVQPPCNALSALDSMAGCRSHCRVCLPRLCVYCLPLCSNVQPADQHGYGSPCCPRQLSPPKQLAWGK